MVNKKMYPLDHFGVKFIFEPYSAVIHLKILIPVEIAMIVVVAIRNSTECLIGFEIAKRTPWILGCGFREKD